MEKYFKRKSAIEEAPIQVQEFNIESSGSVGTKESKRSKSVSYNLDELSYDPGLRPNIIDYPSNLREEVRRAYLLKGPCQPRDHIFPQRNYEGGHSRRFVVSWFDEFNTWLEYSIAKDAVYCLYCYLFKPDYGEQGGGDAFVMEGFTNRKKKERLRIHVGTHDSIHNKCYKASLDLLNQKQHIEPVIERHDDKTEREHRIRLNASVKCLRFLLKQGLTIRGHDESEDSSNRGNFLELLQFIADDNEEIGRVVLKNAPGNLKLTAPSIQKDIINAAAEEVTLAIVKDFQHDLFSVLVDESRDISVKEQMAVVIRYVNKTGFILERFLGLVHVTDTSASSLKEGLLSLFSKHGLSISSLRGQGYDGASNMQGRFNGLKSLIMRENPSAYYVHCFAHQLQPTLIAVAKNNTSVETFFSYVVRVLNVVGCSCKRRDMLREIQLEQLFEGISNGEIISGQGLNQEMTMKRPGDTRWSSHYSSLLSLVELFSPVLRVLETIGKKGSNDPQRGEALDLIDIIEHFEFVFLLHLVKSILAITYNLSQVLQRKDQDIVNAMNLVRVSKKRLQDMRDGGWNVLLNEIAKFCDKYKIDIQNMEDRYIARGRSRRRCEEITNLHHYQVELFYAVIDMQLLELNSRFDEVNTELLTCMASLDPRDSFHSFDKTKLLRLAEFYPSDFSTIDLLALDGELDNYIYDVREDSSFNEAKGIGGLAQKLVATRRNYVYPLVFLLVKLSSILPVATTTVERAFSAMKIIKCSHRNRMGDAFLNDCLVTYIERDIFSTIDNEKIMQQFQKMKHRRGSL